MEYTIHGTAMQVIEVDLSDGKPLYAQCGAMKWLAGDVDVEWSNDEGFLEGIKRLFVEDGKIFTDSYTGRGDGATAVFGHSSPGQIFVFQLTDRALICQKRLFLCAAGAIKYGVHFSRKKGVHFFGESGFVLNQFVGEGCIAIKMDGECVERELESGEVIRVDPAWVGAFEEGVKIVEEDITGAPKRFRGEGGSAFLLKLIGPGKVWLQMQPVQELAKELHRYLPPRPDPR